MSTETLPLEALHPRFQRFVRCAGTGRRLDEIRGIAADRDVDWLREPALGRERHLVHSATARHHQRLQNDDFVAARAHVALDKA